MAKNEELGIESETTGELQEKSVEELAELLNQIRKSGKGYQDLPNGDIMVSYRDANRRTYVVVYSGRDGRTLAVGVQ